MGIYASAGGEEPPAVQWRCKMEKTWDIGGGPSYPNPSDSPRVKISVKGGRGEPRKKLLHSFLVVVVLVVVVEVVVEVLLLAVVVEVDVVTVVVVVVEEVVVVVDVVVVTSAYDFGLDRW